MIDTYKHSFVQVNDPVGVFESIGNGYFRIVRVAQGRVWIHGYATMLDSNLPQAVAVSDGIASDFDGDGCCIVSVPEEWCHGYSEAEVEQAAEFEYAERHMYGYCGP